MNSTREVIEYAKRNGGIISTREAIALGMAQSTLNRRVADGVFVRLSRGLLVLPGTATRSDLRMRAAARYLGAVVSHQSAAALHGFNPIHEKEPTVTVSHRSTHVLAGVTVHQSTDLLEPHIQQLGGFSVTTPPRTVIDLAQVLSRRRLERVIDNTLSTSQVSLDELTDLFSALTRRGKKGMRTLGQILEHRTSEHVPPESELEARLIQLLEDASLPSPVVQFTAPWLRPMAGRVDMAYPAHRVLIEADGRSWHTLYDAFESDRRRDNAAQLAGWIALRFTWRMVEDDPLSVVATVREALRSRSPES